MTAGDDALLGGAAIELRVHGIGDHDPLSAVGTPPKLTAAGDGLVLDWHVLPTRPHRVLLANWSRYSRRLAVFLWHLALPFTLANVTEYFTPAQTAETTKKESARIALATSTTHIVSSLLTILCTLWLVAIGETVLRELALPGLASQWTWLVPCVVGFSLLATVGTRLIRKSASYAQPVIAAWHAFLVAAVLMFVWLLRPALHMVPNSGTLWTQLWTTPYDASRSTEPRLDVLAVGTWGSLSLLVVWTILVALVDWTLRETGDDKPYTTFVMLIGWVATLVLLAAASIIRVGLSWVLDLLFTNFSSLGRFAKVSDDVACFQMDSSAEPGSCGLTPGNRLVLPYQPDTGGFSTWQDFLPWYCLIVGVTVVLAFVVPHINTSTPPGPGGTKGVVARLKHRTITGLQDVVVPASLVGGVAGTALAAMSAVALWNDTRGLMDDIARATVIALGLLGAAWILTRGRLFGSVRKIQSMVADVLGFWPISAHPLSGLSYRDRVVEGLAEGIRDRLERGDTVALVGHSQGSVLAAWTLHAHNLRVRTLITCGSPLWSLYATFFPRYFSSEFFTHVQQMSEHPWRNYWRDTDPIATPVPGATDTELVDDHWPLRGHGDYWVEPLLLARLDQDLNRQTGSTASPATDPTHTTKERRRL